MKLTDEVKGYWKIFRNECDLMLRKGGLREAVATEQIPMVDAVLEAFDTIEALQQEVKGWEQRYDELDAGHSRLFKAFCGLKQENAELQAQNEVYVKALKRAKGALLFYSDSRNYFSVGDVPEKVGMDSGVKANKALAAIAEVVGE